MTAEPPANVARPLAGDGGQGQDALGLREWERDAMLAWVGENLQLVRRSASGQRVLYWSLGTAFAVGLAAHVGGFLLKFSVTSEPVLLVADLLYALGWALWTGVVVVVFVQIYPEAKKRQYKQALDAYEAAGPRAGSGGGQAPAHDWQAAIAKTAGDIRDLDPLADDYDDKLAALRATLKEYRDRPATEASGETLGTGTR